MTVMPSKSWSRRIYVSVGRHPGETERDMKNSERDLINCRAWQRKINQYSRIRHRKIAERDVDADRDHVPAGQNVGQPSATYKMGQKKCRAGLRLW